MASVIRPATPADFAALLDKPLPYRVRALAAEKDGKLLGVGGITFFPEDSVGAFLVLAPGVDRKSIPVTLHKAGLQVMAMIRELGLRRVAAFAQQHNVAAEPWLRRLGFKPTGADGEVVWIYESKSRSS